MGYGMRPKKLVDEQLLIAMNGLGYSLYTIAAAMSCHPSTVTNRLQELGIPAMDTRHSFMELVIDPTSDEVKEWVLNQLTQTKNIKDFVRELILDKYNQRNQTP